MQLLAGTFEERLRKSISFAWQVFMEKTATDLLSINKEASLQLHYSYVLQQVIPLICFNENERVNFELETSVDINERIREIDLVLMGSDSRGDCHKIAVEMKCYRKLTSSGKLRGATDIFMKDVYEDLKLLEEYCHFAEFDRGILLVMNDLERLVHPNIKRGKCWDYDISNNVEVEDIHLTTPIGGKEIDIRLKKSYKFEWDKMNRKGNKVDRKEGEEDKFWFLEVEGN